MIPDKQFKRRVRIESAYHTAAGVHVMIRDVETGDLIRHVKKAVIILEAGEYNAVELTYYETNERGAIIVHEDGEIHEQTIRLYNPEIAVTAGEVDHGR